MDIRAILFDAGNTLIFLDSSVVLPILHEHGIDSDRETFIDAELDARAKLTRRVLDGAFGTEPHIWKEYFGTLFKGCGVPDEEMEAVGEHVYEVHRERHLWTYMDPATPAVLDRLKGDGYRLAVISNADGRVEGLLQEAGIRDRFEFVMDSEIEGVEKPDPEIFLRGCRRLGLPPENVLYVGDLYPVDVLGARKAGLNAVLLDPRNRMDFPVDCLPDVAALPGYMGQLST